MRQGPYKVTEQDGYHSEYVKMGDGGFIFILLFYFLKIGDVRHHIIASEN
jgi:hypothetical protein